MRTFTLNAIALAAITLLGTAAQAQSSAPQELEKVNVTGNGDKLGTGLLIDEDAPKARSSVTKAQLEKTRSSGNPFQALSLLPGVNSSSFDATGMFGGNLRVRGFNSDQMGFTINGAPVNDSGSFSVFPQEYVDSENLCTLYITQGAPDTDSPHVGASGGNVGIVSCAPSDEQAVRVALSGGQLGYYRIFGRVNTGKIGNFKGYVSVSDSKVNKWKGDGRASRKHLDAAAEYDLGGSNKLSATLLYNRAVTNNFQSFNQGQWNTLGYYADYSSVVPQHATPGAGKQTDANPSPAYYGYSLNPFENYLLSGKGSFALTDKLRLDAIPYFWYGYGTGGTQQTALTESTSATAVHGGIADINGDGDTLDTVLVYRGSLTQTFRPGITTSLTYTLDNQRIVGGLWFERARHRQTQPAVHVDNSGGIADIWLGGNLLNYVDGTTYQGRNQMTISTGESVFLQDTVSLLGSKLEVTPAFSYRRIKRDFTNFANSGTSGGGSSAVDYQIDKTYSEPLPSLAVSYQALPSLQVFGSVAKNFKAPGNFEYQNLAKMVTNVATVTSGFLPLTVKQETSINVDLGVRYKGDGYRGSVTAFYNKFKDRIASSFDPNANITHDFNVGDSKTKGVEIEAGTVPVKGFSAYASLTYTKSTLDDNMSKDGNPANDYQTAGKQFPDTPKKMAALSLQYANGPGLVNVAAKYTGSRFLSLTNDVEIPGFTTVDLNAAWKFPNPSGTGFKNPIIRLNVSNLLNKQYFLANAGSGSNIVIVGAPSIVPGSTAGPFYYAGAPRFTSVTFQVDY